MEDSSTALLTTLAEAGGITGMITLMIAMLIRLIKKNGCTLRCNNCSGTTIAEVDCEKGSAQQRYFEKAQQNAAPEKTSSSGDQ